MVRSRRCIVSLFLLSGLIARGAHAQPDTVIGRVVDEAGAGIVRAPVRILADTGAVTARTVTGRDGRFVAPRSRTGGCRVEVALVGFVPALVPCGAGPDLVVTLKVAPLAETVVVSATREPAPTSQIGTSVTVFDARDIERAPRPFVADLVQQSPGVTISRVGGFGHVTSMFVRGGESSYNKVLLDGVPINEPGGFFNFGGLATAGLARIEVARGAHSAVFGSDAMASVIQLFSERGERDRSLRMRATVEVGSYDTRAASAAAGGATGDWDYSVTADHHRTDNGAPNDAFDNTTLATTVGLTVSPTLSLRLVGRGEFGRTGTPGATAFGRPDLDAFFRRHDGVGGATLDHRLGPDWTQRVSYGLTVSSQRSANLVADPPYTPAYGGRSAPFPFFDFPYDSRTDLRRHHLSYQSDWQLGGAGGWLVGQVITTALDWDGERGVFGDRLAGTSVRAARDNVGWTLQHQALGRRTSVTSGLRIEHNASFGTAVVPRVSVAVLVGSASGWFGETKLKANVGLGIKEPSLIQSFSPSPFFLGNPDLDPERSRSVDAGVEQRLWRQRAKVEFVWFDNRFEDQISTRTIGFDPFEAQYFNIGRTVARGTELTLDLAATAGLHVRGGHTFLASQVVRSTAPTNPVFQPGSWLFKRPRHSGFLQISWHRFGVGADLRGTFVGRRVDSDFSALEPPLTTNAGYGRWDLAVSYRTSAHLTWVGVVDNLTDAEYMEPLGYPALGRALRVSVRASF